ncbi:hypothetical protein [Pedobacter gandavensis]|uniref:hypothetical protein n=1 Tax=Pedobacter gandavensis TaxID=2679963 RepID=UPI00292CCB76|nr:hypothetical protein [Pedobacter gandavensis]
MTEQLTKYAGLIPLAAIFVYILGYISLSAYLQSYGIDENIGLDFNILKLGILLSIIIGPVIFLSFSTFKIGDYSNAVPEVSDGLINTLHDALGYTIFYSLNISGLLFKYTWDVPTICMAAFLVIGFILNKVPLKPTANKFLKGFFIMVPFFVFLIMILEYPFSGKNGLYFLHIMVYTACATLRIFNKEGITYQISKIGIMITTILSSSNVFGEFLMDDIPAKYGGEKRLTKTYFINDTELEKIKQTALQPFIGKKNELTLQVIYDNGDSYYFKVPPKKVVSIPKSYIGAGETTLTKSFR